MGVTRGPATKWAERGFYLSLTGAAGGLALLAAAKSEWGLALATLVIGAVWGGAYHLGYRWLSPLAFVALTICAAAGVWHSLPAAGLVIVVAVALAAWDLHGLAARLSRFEPRPDQIQLVKNHLRRLLTICGLGIILGEAAITLHFAWSMEAVAGLGIVSVLLLLLALRLLDRDADETAKDQDA